MMNQVQILSLIFANIIWSVDLPPALITALNFVGNLLSLNLSDFLSSPECVAELDPLARWSIALALPFFLALLFLAWFVLARNRRRCCERTYTDEDGLVRSTMSSFYADDSVSNAIIQSAVHVLLIGLFSTVVSTCFVIFDCTSSSAKLGLAGALVLDPTKECSEILGYQIVGGVFFFFWVVLPFFILSTQICKYRNRLSEKLEESDTFRILYGWALENYCLQKSLSDRGANCLDCAPWWEVFNVVIKVTMVAGTKLMYKESRTITHIVAISFSLLGHIVVQPYKYRTANAMVVYFCILDLIAIHADNDLVLQIIVIGMTLLALIGLGSLYFRSRLQMRKQSNGQRTYAGYNFSALERTLLFPLLMLIWPMQALGALCTCKSKRRVAHGTKVLPREKSGEEGSLPRVRTPRLHELRGQMEMANRGKGGNQRDSTLEVKDEDNEDDENEKNRDEDNYSSSDDSSEDDRVGHYF